MATEGQRFGRFKTPEGVTRSARIAALQAAVNASSEENPEPVIKFTLADGAAAINESSSGGKRKMRGGTIQEALLRGSTTLQNAAKTKLERFNAAIEHAIGDMIPQIIIDYTKPTLKGLALTAVLKYPTVFARIIATAIRLIPVPSGAEWSTYKNAFVIIAQACTDLGITLGESALTGPVLAGVIGLYVQSKRAVKNNRTFGEQCLADGNTAISLAGTAVSAVSGTFKQQIEAFKRESRKLDGRAALKDLRDLADSLEMEPTPELVGIEGIQPVPDVVDEEGKQFLRQVPARKSSRKRGPALTPEQVEATGYDDNIGRPGQAKVARTDQTPSKPGSEGPSSAPSAFMSPVATASSSMPPEQTTSAMVDSTPPSSSSSSTSTQPSGGRRRKTRKPKKIRRITRRFRRHFAY
jgi:hypothetical protein